MNNRFFSLIIVPDSGNEVKTGSFDHRLLPGIFFTLIAAFFVCLFFIIGYHIKLSQEIEYKHAVSEHHTLIAGVEHAGKTLDTLAEAMLEIQNNDKAFRLIESMNVIDDEMYQAGIGGHVIADISDFEQLGDDLRVTLSNLAYGSAALASRIITQRNSLKEIGESVLLHREMLDNTPSIIPTYSYRITESYGYRTHPITGLRDFHAAIDLGGNKGQDIFATADGVVIAARYQRELGNYVKIRHKFGYETLYGHLSETYVKVGQQVNKRDIIGAMGRTGRTTGIHLHYGVALNGRAENPVKYFK